MSRPTDKETGNTPKKSGQQSAAIGGTIFSTGWNTSRYVPNFRPSFGSSNERGGDADLDPEDEEELNESEGLLSSPAADRLPLEDDELDQEEEEEMDTKPIISRGAAKPRVRASRKAAAKPVKPVSSPAKRRRGTLVDKSALTSS